jgi:uncharacterized protein
MANVIKKLVKLGVDLSTKKALKRSLSILGIEPDNIDKLYIELKNSINEDAFRKAPKNKKLVFLPQCLRDSKNCKAKINEDGYVCAKCSLECKARQVKELAEKLGYRVFLVPGGSMIKTVIDREGPKAVMGVACIKELNMAFDEIKLPVQGVELSRDGCVNTDVNLEDVRKVLDHAHKVVA